MANHRIAFSQYLSAFRKQVDSTEVFEHTHTRIGNSALNVPGGSYRIPVDAREGLIEKYRKSVFGSTTTTPSPDGAHLKPSGHEYLTERQHPTDGPILIDIDLRYDASVDTRQHTVEHIDDLVEMIGGLLGKILVLGESPPTIPVYVMEKDTVNPVDGKTKDGIHILIGCAMDKAGQLLLRQQTLPEIANVWEDIPITNRWDDVLDEAVTKGSANWQLYGSRKPGHDAYRITQYYEFVPGTHTFCTEKRSLETLSLGVVLRTVSAQNTTFPKLDFSATYAGMRDDIAKAMVRRTPRSSDSSSDTDGSDTSTRGTSGLYDRIYRARPYTWEHIQHIDSVEILDEEIALLLEADDHQVNETSLRETHDYTMLLPEEYYGPGSYSKWYAAGLALRNTDHRLFLVWLRMSCKSVGFVFGADVRGLLAKWREMPSNSGSEITHRSIMFWARTADPVAYNAVKATMTTTYIKDVIQCVSEVNIARLMYHLYKDEWVCVSISSGVWYHFTGGRWKESESGTGIRQLISGQVHDVFFRYLQQEVLGKTARVADESILGEVGVGSSAPRGLATTNTAPMIPTTHTTPKVKETNEEKDAAEVMNKLSSITEHCKRTGWKNNVMVELKEAFYDEEFIGNLDNNPRLMCFRNGVLDFDKKIFRPGQPEDCLSMCTNCDYIPLDELTSSDSQRKIGEINEFIDQLFPNEILRTYMWDHLASLLIGNNMNCVFNIYNGNGCNGKSKMVDFMTECLGDYFGTVPITLVTQKRSTLGSASPEVALLKGVRYAVMSEPSKTDKLNEGILKQLTGGDLLQGRALYASILEFKPQFKLAVCTNTLFDIDVTDDGTWRRLHVNPFESKFVDAPYEEAKFPKKSYPYQFKKDLEVENKFQGWVPVMMSMLSARAFVTNGVVVPNEIVESACMKYRSSQDYLLEFTTDTIIEKDGSVVTKTDLNQAFKTWYQDAYGKAPPRLREVHDYMENKYGSLRNAKWYNIAIKGEEIEDDTDDPPPNQAATLAAAVAEGW
jgi:P4 family phage/plasmid primase-like protien